MPIPSAVTRLSTAARHDEKPVAGGDHTEKLDPLGCPSGQCDRLLLRPEDDVGDRTGREGEADREKDMLKLGLAINMADQRSFESDADCPCQQKRDRQHEQKRNSQTPGQDHKNVAPAHGEGAMCEIDEPHQPQGDRQADREQEEKHSVSDTVDDNRKEAGQVHLAGSRTMSTTAMVLLDPFPSTNSPLRM
jgi:hypothetical protein